MGNYTSITDELCLVEQNSRSSSEKPLKKDVSDSPSFVEAQQGPPVELEYSIANGLKDPNFKTSRASIWYSSLLAIPMRRRVVVGVSVFFGVIFIFIVTISAIASRKPSANPPTTIQENQFSVQFENDDGNSSWFEDDNESDSRFDSPGRGEGGGAANSGFVQSNIPNSGFVQSNIKNIFLGEDVLIPPFSVLDPVQDLDRYGYNRPTSSSPSARLDPLIGQKQRAIPTNAWYQNMLRLDIDEEPTKDHRVYTVPYVIDAAGDFPGIRAHATRLEATPTQVRLAIDEPYALSLGASADMNLNFDATELEKGYTVTETKDLGLTLQWTSYMKTTLVRGSPYVTMVYDMSDRAVSEGLLPTMFWSLDTSELPIIDGRQTVDCESEPVFTVERDLELVFFNSDQRWILFFSRPVQIQCQNNRGRPTIFQVVESQNNDDEDSILIIRGALVVSSSNTADDGELFQENYANQLRASADVYPGESTAVTHSFNKQSDIARISFDWDAQSMRTGNANGANQMISRNTNEMIMFALPHHQEILAGKVSPTLCTTSLLGPVCLVEGNVWNMYENLPPVDFRALRHPDPKYIPLLAQALVNDIRYQIPSNFQSGAADTYFSGKTTAKLARILLVAEEVKELCASVAPNGRNSEYEAACDGLELPSEEEIEEALDQLREVVTVWVRTNSQAPFIYDESWGGLVSCGCLYNFGQCTNVYPECPSFTDQGLNFGNGFYNDHHFHYGYHIYAAATLAHFDSSWAIEHYEDVTLLVRDYANPSQEDTAFPVFRNKDWYRGHSWASGLTKPMFGNIMNQESSSEAIMAYEAVALFGKTMASIFQDAGDSNMASVARMMHKIGLTLTATEIRSTQKYWQVQQNVEDSEKIYPEVYRESVVGVLWETFVHFTTWFGNAPYLIYGIQLLPLTPISEARDGIEWANEIYEPLAASCDGLCVSQGWSVQVNAILATIGRVQEAIEGILAVPSNAYEHAGGNGHSKSNALWYITTRPISNTPSFQNEGSFEASYDGENFESPNTAEKETINTDNEEFEKIDIDEVPNTASGDGQESEVTIGDDFPFDSIEDDFFEDLIIRDEIVTEEEANGEGDTGNEDNNIFNENPAEIEDNGSDFIVDVEEIFDDTVDAEDFFDDDISNDFANDGFGNEENDDLNGEATTVGLNCSNPTGCTSEVLDTDAEGYSCRARIQWLIDEFGTSEIDACQQVAVEEYPIQCGSCQPSI